MGNLSIASVFTDNMVLQRNKKVCIFGTADDCAIVEIEFNNQLKRARCEEGKWKVYLDEEPAGGPYIMSIICDSNIIKLQNILVGDVYLAAGQSNMEFTLKEAENGIEEIKNYKNDNIRFYNVPKIQYEDEKEVIPNVESKKWETVNSSTSGEFSAVAYFFAKRIQKDLNIPIGIVGCNYGGTSASCWMSEEYLSKDEHVKKVYVDRYKDIVKDLTEEQEEKNNTEYTKIFNEYQKKLNDYKEKHPGISLEELKAAVGHTPWPPPMGRKSMFRPYGLYYTMLKKIIPFTFKAVLWYQGEEDKTYCHQYKALFKNLIANWRNEWNDEKLHFIFVQLPAYEEQMAGTWPYIRQAQLDVLKEVDYTDMIVSMDYGEKKNVHPIKKQIVGDRLAYLVEDKIYNLIDDGTCPIYENCKMEEGKLIISFDYYEKQELVVYGSEIKGFEVSEDGKNYITVKAEIIDNKVLLDTRNITKPAYVRYAWSDYCEVNLFNKRGFAASPFMQKLN